MKKISAKCVEAFNSLATDIRKVKVLSRSTYYSLHGDPRDEVRTESCVPLEGKEKIIRIYSLFGKNLVHDEINGNGYFFNHHSSNTSRERLNAFLSCVGANKDGVPIKARTHGFFAGDDCIAKSGGALCLDCYGNYKYSC